MSDLEFDLKRLVIETLNLEGIQPEDISSDEPLFGEGLGLDSIDGLELGVALRRTYGLKIEAVTEETRRHFASIKSMAAFVASQQERQ